MAIIVFQHAESEHPGRLGDELRRLGVRLDIRRLDLPAGPGSQGNRHVPPDFDEVEGVISLGGPMMVSDHLPWMQTEMDFLAEAHRRQVPLVGVCLGAQLIAKALGGEVSALASGKPEWGMLPVRQHPVANTDIILAGVPWTTPQFHCHGQEVSKLPAGAATLQFSDACKVQSYRVGLRTYAFQYHFECSLADIRGHLFSGDAQIAQAGIDPSAAFADAKAQYETYDRVSRRLCENLAMYLFMAASPVPA